MIADPKPVYNIYDTVDHYDCGCEPRPHKDGDEEKIEHDHSLWHWRGLGHWHHTEESDKA
jgi:hypothetical protein